MKALISVYDKTGIIEFAKGLAELGFEAISSGGTAKVLQEAGMRVQDVADLSGREAILGHRVVTLTPEIHGGLLATEAHRDELAKLGFPWIDLVCVDLYPLEEETLRPGATRESIIEKTDIGGPTILRSAAKGRRIVVADHADRARVLAWLRAGKPNEEKFVDDLCAKAEAIVAKYCLTSARARSGGANSGFMGTLVRPCVYGENAWQTPAGCYGTSSDDPLSLERFELVEGETPSYNNWCDIDRLLQTITHIAAAFDKNFGNVPKIAVGVKHGNPCGAAFGENSIEVLQKTISGDPLAIFGGLIMTNFPIGVKEAECVRRWVMEGAAPRLLDGVIAPSFSEEARVGLSRKGGRCRMFENSALTHLTKKNLDAANRFRYVRGGFLQQPNYAFVLHLKDPVLERTGVLEMADEKNLLLAWAIGSTSNSNTIALAKEGMLIGNGVGQQDRVGAAKLAVERARRSGHDATGAVAYSDSFFPFSDGPGVLADAGVKAIFASSGSVKDDEIKAFCKTRGVIFCSMPDKLCRGFYNH